MIEELLTLIGDVLYKEYKFIRIDIETNREQGLIRVITSFFYIGKLRHYERYYQTDVNVDTVAKDYIKYFKIHIETL